MSDGKHCLMDQRYPGNNNNNNNNSSNNNNNNNSNSNIQHTILVIKQ